MKTPRSILALSFGLLGLAASHASAQTVISTAPITISTPGHYILGGNLSSTSTTAPAILVNAPNVVIDLNQYFVAGPGNTAATFSSATSVISVGNFANVTIKNGTVAGGVAGIYFQATTAGTTSRNFVLDNVTVTAATFMASILLPRPLARSSRIARSRPSAIRPAPRTPFLPPSSRKEASGSTATSSTAWWPRAPANRTASTASPPTSI